MRSNRAKVDINYQTDNGTNNGYSLRCYMHADDAERVMIYALQLNDYRKKKGGDDAESTAKLPTKNDSRNRTKKVS